jgi:peptide chain release factor 1
MGHGARCGSVVTDAETARRRGDLGRRVAALADELDHVEAQLSDPAVTSDRDRFVALSRRHSQLDEVVSIGREWQEATADADAARELWAEVEGQEREAVKEMEAAAEARAGILRDRFDALLLPRDPNDDRGVIVEIRGAEGGEEANLFARDLFEMYRQFAASRGWEVEVLESRPSDLGGYTEVTFLVRGDGAWSGLKHEAGPHRVQRVPVTESQGRVHTSSATVVVLPEAEEIDVQIDPADLQIDVFRASGPGGQSVNTTDSAVRISHRPSGISVSMQDEKSQLQNKDKAMRVLRSRLLQTEQAARAAETAAAKRGQVGGGGRSEKIRTYNFKEGRVTDHRIGLTLHRLDRILAGGLDELVDALARDERERQLAQADSGSPG